MSKNGKLYLIPSVLAPGTADTTISGGVKMALPTLKHFLVENVRTSRRFISSLKLGIVIESLEFEVLDKKTKSSEVKKYFEPIRKGNDIGLLSEAGCPGVADPGALAVDYAHKNGIEVVPLVGPSSILLALMASGMNGQKFSFQGYLPIDKNDRVKVIKVLEKESMAKSMTQIFIETPFRNNHMLESLLSTCMPQTKLCIACNLTGENQWVRTLTIIQWRKQLPELHKIPVVFLIQA